MKLDEALEWTMKNCTPETVGRLRSRDVAATLADEVNALLTLAEDAHEARNKDDDTRVGKLLLAMMDRGFRKTYRPDLVKVGAGETGKVEE
jgi:hypothetical protein